MFETFKELEKRGTGNPEGQVNKVGMQDLHPEVIGKE